MIDLHARLVIICIMYILSVLLLGIYNFDGFDASTWKKSMNLSMCPYGSLPPSMDSGLFKWNPITLGAISTTNSCFAYPAALQGGVCPNVITNEMAAFGITSLAQNYGSIVESPTAGAQLCIFRFGGSVMAVPLPTTTQIVYVVKNFVPNMQVNIDVSQGWSTTDPPLSYDAVIGNGSVDIVVLGVNLNVVTLQFGSNSAANASVMVKGSNYAGSSFVTWNVSVSPPELAPSPLPSPPVVPIVQAPTYANPFTGNMPQYPIGDNKTSSVTFDGIKYDFSSDGTNGGSAATYVWNWGVTTAYCDGNGGHYNTSPPYDYIGNANTPGYPNGAWWQITASVSTHVSAYSLSSNGGGLSEWYVLGSINGGASFSVIDHQSYNWSGGTISVPGNTSMYTTYRFIVVRGTGMSWGVACNGFYFTVS